MKARRLRLRAPAKLNLFLEVLGKRPDAAGFVGRRRNRLAVRDDDLIGELGAVGPLPPAMKGGLR